MQIENEFGEVLCNKGSSFFITTYIEEVFTRGKWMNRRLLGINSDQFFDLPLNSRRITERSRRISRAEAMEWYMRHEFPKELIA